MLAGCPTLLSPRHRLSSEGSSQFQVSHYPLSSMSTTQRLDLSRSFSHKEVVASRSQTSRPTSLSVEIPTETKKSCSIRPNVRIPSPITASTQTVIWEEKSEDRFWEKGRNLKRFSEQSSSEESSKNRAKRKRSSGSANTTSLESLEGERFSVSQLGCGDFWFNQTGGDPIPVLGGITGFHHAPLPFSTTEDERIRLVPRNVIRPPSLPLPNIPWIECKGGEDVVKSEEDSKKVNPTSSASSETNSSPRKLTDGNQLETGNGSSIPCPSERAQATEEGLTQTENSRFDLVNLLVTCVESISSKNLSTINQYLSRLGELASPEGPTPIHRVVAYFTEALAIRIARMWPHIFHINIPRDIDQAADDMATSFRLLNHVSPIPKFLHYTANEMLLRSFEGKDRVHIIDFDIQQGLQWTGLFQSLALRPNPPTHVRITGVGECKQELQDTGDRLAGFAQALNLPFEFHPVVDRLEDVRLWMLHVKDGECVAVNCILQLHKVLYDESGGSLRDFLGLIRSTNPNMVLMAEQEAEHNDARWEMRFSNSLKYYSAIFDSIDSSLPPYSAARIKIEEMFAREIRNIVANEGSERVERHETFKKWRTLMEESGFRCLGVRERDILQSQMLLKMYSCDSYRVEKQEENEGLTLSWLDRPLYTVSSWEPVELGGSSSSISQPS